MKITWYGTASILIETDNARILFDPYMKDLPAGGEPQALAKKRKEVFQTQENILITHGHLDHLSSIKELYQDRPCSIYLTETPRQNLLAQGLPQENLHTIWHGDCLQFADMTVHVFRGKHIQYDMGIARQVFSRIKTKEQFTRLMRLAGLNRRYPEKKETLIFEISAEGKRIQLMGSAGLADGVTYHTGADVLILPHQGRSNMDTYNRVVVQKLKPKRVLMDHYDDAFPPISMEVPVDAFCREMSNDIPTEKLVEGVPVCI